jgi:tetratricopeptide (TPR) repeat protein
LHEAWCKNRNLLGAILLKDETGPHQSLHIALHMSYEVVKNNAHALRLWGMLYYLPGSMSGELLDQIVDSSDDHFDRKLAVKTLLQNSLIKVVPLPDHKQDGYSMLSSIKGMAFEFSKAHREDALTFLHDAFASIYRKANQLDNSDRNHWHDFALDCLSSVLGFLIRTPVDDSRNRALLHLLGNYLQFSSVQALEVLRHYEKKISNRYFSAYVFYTTGDLEKRLGQIEDALAHYAQAEALFRAEKANLGLANVLQSRGDLERAKNAIDQAIAFYAAALPLYEAEQEPMGKGYALGELCRVYALASDCAQSQKYAKEAKKQADRLPDLVATYIKQCIDEAREICQK